MPRAVLLAAWGVLLRFWTFAPLRHAVGARMMRSGTRVQRLGRPLLFADVSQGLENEGEQQVDSDTEAMMVQGWSDEARMQAFSEGVDAPSGVAAAPSSGDLQEQQSGSESNSDSSSVVPLDDEALTSQPEQGEPLELGKVESSSPDSPSRVPPRSEADASQPTSTDNQEGQGGSVVPFDDEVQMVLENNGKGTTVESGSEEKDGVETNAERVQAPVGAGAQSPIGGTYFGPGGPPKDRVDPNGVPPVPDLDFGLTNPIPTKEPKIQGIDSVDPVGSAGNLVPDTELQLSKLFTGWSAACFGAGLLLPLSIICGGIGKMADPLTPRASASRAPHNP